MNNVALHSLLHNGTQAASGGGCVPESTFVTLVANETYVDGALCLRRSLKKVGSVCPLMLIVSDPMPGFAMERLGAEFGRGEIRLLSELRQRLDHFERRQLTRKATEEDQVAGRRLSTEAGAEIKSTRQLGRSVGWAKRTHQKLLVFAIKGYRRAVFVDIDVHVTRNIDALMSQPAFSAVAALPYSTKDFNSGVFVFEPSLTTAAALDDLAQRATFSRARPSSASAGTVSAAGRSTVRIRGSGERFALSDQSILNHYYRNRWHPLPFGYNLGVKVKQVSPRVWSRIDVAVVHFVHRPKPWEASLADPASPMSSLARRLGIDPLLRAWRAQCLDTPQGTPPNSQR
jgi:hypothetical protein